MSKRSYGQFCALAQALDQIGDRWTLLILRDLLPGPARFRDLQESLPGLATNLLTQRLRSLEENGVVLQDTLPPPAGVRVYRLTPRGQQLGPAIEAIAAWGMDLMASADYRRPGNVRGITCGLRIPLRERIQAEDSLRITLRVAEQDIACVIEGGELEVTLGEAPGAAARVICDYPQLFSFIGGGGSFGPAIDRGEASLEGERSAVDTLDQIRLRPG